ncbi:hypothetical protein D3C87_637040 [compost metagenome]
MDDRPEQRVTQEYLIENFDECLLWLDATGGRIFILDEDGEPTTVMISAEEARYLGILNDENSQSTD